MGLFNSAFTLRFNKDQGVAGNETGGFRYLSLRDSFSVAVVDGNNATGFTYAIPGTLDDSRYTYVRTSPNSGRITLTWAPVGEVYPNRPANMNAPDGFAGQGDLFWGGPETLQTSLELDILFADTTTSFISSTTTRIRFLNIYSSTFTAPGPAVPSITQVQFDSDTTRLTKTVGGGQVEAGYNPEIDPDLPGSLPFANFQGKTLLFSSGGFPDRLIAHQSSTNTPTVSIPGEAIRTIEDSGVILVDEDNSGGNERGLTGQFSYKRTGGSAAKFAITYSRAVGSVSIVYTLRFESFDGGSYTDSNGGSGTFEEDRRTDLGGR